MKKVIFFAAVASAALTGCVKNEVILPQDQKEISFEVADYVSVPQTRAYSNMEEGAFLAYAWYNNGDEAENVQIMDATLVDRKQDKNSVGYLWAPSRPHYWPMEGSLDFIGIYPKGYQRSEENYESRPEVTPDTITWTDHFFNDPKGTTDHDIRYTDKAVGYTNNNTAEQNAAINGIEDYGFKGVPMLFHHAAAKISIKTVLKRDKFQVYSGTNEEGANSNDALGRYHWQVEVKKVTLNGHYNKGSLELTLAQQEAGNPLVGWNLPEDKLWTVSKDKSTAEEKKFDNVTWLDTKDEYHLHSYLGEPKGEGINLGPFTKDNEPAEVDKVPVEYIVMPQALEAGQQTITVVYTLYQQYDPSGDGSTELIDQGAKTFTKTFDLYTENLPTWQMNKHITYIIEFWPGGHNPGVWPDDPNNLEDTHAIFFAPAVEDWDTTDAEEDFEITPAF